MPSGSHGGHSHSGGSRSSGGGHSSSFGGGHSSSGYRGGVYYRRPFRVYWGHHYYSVPTRYSGLMSLFMVLFIFGVFFIFAGSIMLSQANTDLGKVQRDYDRYQLMIEHARATDGLIIDGTPITCYYDNYADKWYFTYIFTIDGVTVTNGESYSVYTMAEARAIADRDTVELAIERFPENAYDDDIDSVPTDYYGMPIERDGAYTSATNTAKVGRIMLIVAVSVVVGSVVLNIVIFATTKKRDDAEQKTTASTGNTTATNTTTATNNNTTTTATGERKSLYCEYCGQLLEATDKKCPSCGAKIKK